MSSTILHPARLSLVVATLLLPAAVWAQPNAAKPCDAPECRQFDFWIGTWEVRTPDGQIAGTNRIEKILDGCVLEENWTGARGMRGKSFNLYTPGDRRWHQSWVDSNGGLLLLAGEFRDGKMVLSGEAPQADGKVASHRITWEKLADGRVRQHWQTSNDGGKIWADAFLGTYTKKKP
jgi:hypothetical protein